MQQQSTLNITTPKNNNCWNIRAVLGNLRKIPYNKLRSNKYKIQREAWCVAKMLEYLSLDNYLVCANPTQADSTDIIVISPDSRYKVQVTEIAPKSIKSNTVFDSAIVHGYSTLEVEMLELLQTTVQDKEEKYSESDKESLNLLIYFNPPTKQVTPNSSAWTIVLDPELDLDLPNIQRTLYSSKFGSILLLTGNEVFFLKNDRLV